MSGTSTIVVAREDLSIPGMEPVRPNGLEDRAAIQSRFFDLLRNSRPDVVVLDLSDTKGHGIEAIRRIRQRCSVPIIVVCDAADAQAPDYRLAGATESVPTPVDIIQFNRTIQRIIRLTAPFEPEPAQQQDALSFAGITFRPDHNVLRGPGGGSIRLTTAENYLLSHFLSRARSVCSRAELIDILYGRHRPTSDRAIDTVVNRLRKKLVSAGGPNAEHVVKTEFRRGYTFVADVSVAPSDELGRMVHVVDQHQNL